MKQNDHIFYGYHESGNRPVKGEPVESYFNPFSKSTLLYGPLDLAENALSIDSRPSTKPMKKFAPLILKQQEPKSTIANSAISGKFSTKPLWNYSNPPDQSLERKIVDSVTKFDVNFCDEVKTISNCEGKEFVYFENLEDVKKVLSQKYPSMNKNDMYKELLKPYKYHVTKERDSKTRQLKEVYKCGYGNCNKIFNKTWNLVDHLRMHEGIKPYQCEICCKLFTQKGNLKKHLKQHLITDVNHRKKYKWDICGKGYTERYNWLVSARKQCHQPRPKKFESVQPAILVHIVFWQLVINLRL